MGIKAGFISIIQKMKHARMLETGAPGVAVLASHLRRLPGLLGPLWPLPQEPRGLGTSSWEAVVSPSRSPSGGGRVCTHHGHSTSAGVAGSPVRDVTAAPSRGQRVMALQGGGAPSAAGFARAVCR